MRMIWSFRWLWLAATLILAGCDQATRHHYADEENIRSIAWLRSQIDRHKSVVICEDAAIRGRITANDRYGEFPKQLVIEDATGAITVAANSTDLFISYPFGAEVTLLCNGLTLYDYGGKVELGDAEDEYGNRGIPHDELPSRLHMESAPDEPPAPALLRFAEIDMRLTDCYVRFDNVCLTEISRTWCATDPETGLHITTEHEMVDADGNTLTLRIPATVEYATEPVPLGTGSVCGILDYFGGRFSLRPTNYEIIFGQNCNH